MTMHTAEMSGNLTLRQSMVDEILLKMVCGVRTATNQKYGAKRLLTTGTALRGEIILGDKYSSQVPTIALHLLHLADNLRGSGLEIEDLNGQSRHHQLITKKLKFNQVMKSQIIFHSVERRRLPSGSNTCWLTYT